MKHAVPALLVFLMCCEPITAQHADSVVVTSGSNGLRYDTLRLDRPFAEVKPVDYWRVAAVGGAAVSTLGASYLYLKDTWWKETGSSFHFDQGGDMKYALNLDKVAHFYGGHIAADLFTGALRWAYVPDKTAAWYGTGLGIFVQFAIELKDAYAPRWGFSVWDVVSGSIGSFFFLAKHYSPIIKAIDVKFSYWHRSDHYFHLKETGRWNDDYVNQTYWASFKVNELVPRDWEPFWPDWLAIAIGLSLDDKIVGYDPKYPDRTGGSHEIYLAFDVDVTKILPSNNSFWEGVKHYLNYVKFPAPAIRLTPGVIWYGLYF